MTWSLAAVGGTGNTDIVLLQVSNDATYGSTAIQSYRNVKETSMSIIPIPTMDSNQVIGLDILGTTRNITISGFVTGTLTQLKEFINDIEGKIYGKQFTNTNKGCTLTVELAATGVTTYNVIIKSFNYEWLAGEPSRMEYTLEMLEVRST